MGDKEVTLTRYESGKCVILENAKDPVIALKGEATITLKVGESYTEPGVEAKTVDGSELTYTVEIKKDEEIVSSIDTSKAGRYVITYKAESNGKISTITRVVEIEASGTSGNELAIKDNLEDLASMKRYRGENPNNWVCFGSSSITNPSNCDENHLWRIIGIDNDGKMKIMTNYYYSESKAWDTSDSNNWGRPADLKTELEGSSFYSNNSYIDGTHREYIVDATWYTGGTASSPYTLQKFIDTEKNNHTTGYVGLMSMTDYGYASSSCTTDTNMNVTRNACMSNNWIGNAKDQWSITPWSPGILNVWYVSTDLIANSCGVSRSLVVRPSVFLDASIKIIDGNGTESEPYILKK